MKASRALRLALPVAFCVAGYPLVSEAHGIASAAGFMDGLLHPVLGVDHFLAMLSVGIVSAQLGGRNIYLVPSAFVLAMIVGAVVGVLGKPWPLTETGIALSVVTLGLLIGAARSGRFALPVLVVVAAFGSLHGHAHGVEMPRAADPVYYAGGFLMSTALIHLAGVGIGHVLTRRPAWTLSLRLLGTGMSAVGVVILLSALRSS